MNMVSSHLPPRNRRETRRFLTLRNAAFAGVGIVALFVAISLISEFRGKDDDGYGRLYERRAERANTKAPASESMIVHEGDPIKVNESTWVDPLSIDSAKREQYLGVTSPELVPPPPELMVATEDVKPIDVKPLGSLDGAADGAPKATKSRFKISGGAGGLQVTVQKD